MPTFRLTVKLQDQWQDFLSSQKEILFLKGAPLDDDWFSIAAGRPEENEMLFSTCWDK